MIAPALLLCALQLGPPTTTDQVASDLDRRVTPEVLVVRAAAPAVVYIETDVKQLVRTFFGTQEVEGHSSGSGAVIFEEGYIVTNYHVVKDADRITVSFDKSYDPASYPARLISYVREEDLALIKIEGERPFPTVQLGTSADLMIGERVVAIGNPYGQSNTVSSGIISGLHREIDVTQEGLHFTGLIQTDASINPGNSGGPLLNINGELIGINAAMRSNAENIGFAIPVDRVRQVLEENLLSTRLAAAWTGYEVDEESLVVTSIVSGGPAAQAGLEVGDRLRWIGEKTFEDPGAYRLARLAVAPHEPFTLRVERGRDELQLTLQPWSQIDGLLYERVGFTVEPIVFNYTYNRSRAMARSVRVERLRPGGPAAVLGLQEGDILDAIQVPGRQPTAVKDPAELALALRGLPTADGMAINVWRDTNENGRYERTSNPAYSELFSGELRIE